MSALALASIGAYGAATPRIAGAQVALGAPQEYTLRESTKMQKAVPSAHTVLPGDGSLHIAQRAFREAQMTTDALRAAYARHGLRIENVRTRVDGIATTEKSHVKTLATLLPHSPANAQAYFCPPQNKILSYCAEHHLMLGSPQRPNVVRTNILIDYDVVKEHKFTASTHYRALPGQSGPWYTMPALGGAAGLFAATHAMRRPRARVQAYRPVRAQPRPSRSTQPAIIDIVPISAESFPASHSSDRAHASYRAAAAGSGHAARTYKYTKIMEQYLRENGMR